MIRSVQNVEAQAKGLQDCYYERIKWRWPWPLSTCRVPVDPVANSSIAFSFGDA